MQDLEIILENKVGQLALMGETLGKTKLALKVVEYLTMVPLQLLIF